MNFGIFLATLGLALAKDSDYIINGRDVTEEGKWPWQGSLRAWGGHTCGISLISPTWGVTTANCVPFEESAYSVIFGTNNRFHDGVSANVKKIIKHEDYGSGDGFYANDIAVIEFDKSISGDNVAAIPLATKGSDHTGNLDCWITGWGYTVPGTSMPEVLQEAIVDVMTNAKCKETWKNWVGEGHVCTGGTGSAACQGDSGGPLMCKVDGRYELVGGASWGPAGCEVDAPAVFTRIAHYRDWIKTKTGV